MNELAHIPIAETHLLSSRHVAQTFKIQIQRPLLMPRDTERFPVVYATDGNQCFDMLKGISQIIQTNERDAPRFILVGIGYPGDSPAAGSALRARDLTFPGYPRIAIPPPPVAGVAKAAPGTKDFHGADDFQNFLCEELIPFVDAGGDVLQGARTYFGHSAGAGFGLYTLCTRPELFNNYILSSPGLIYHGRSSAGVDYEQYEFALDYARKLIDARRALPEVGLYLSVGSDEEFEPGLEQWQLTSSFYRLARLLAAAAIPGLRVHAETLAGETHMTVWPMAFIHGIQAVMRTGRWRSSTAHV